MSLGKVEEEMDRFMINVIGIFRKLAPSRMNLDGISSRPVLLYGLSFRSSLCKIFTYSFHSKNAVIFGIK
jgi:hypothetical protein